MDSLENALGNVWGNLGKGSANDAKVEELQQLLSSIHTELLGTTEALEKRMVALEYENKMLREKLESVTTTAQANTERFTNVFNLMSPEELLGRPLKAPQYQEDEVEDVEVVSVKGFKAPPPEPDLPEDEEVEIVLDEEDPMMEWVDKTYAHITEEKGVMNYRMKALGLLPNEVTRKQKKFIYEQLENLGVKRYKVNKMYEFFYIGDGDGKELYEEFQNKK